MSELPAHTLALSLLEIFPLLGRMMSTRLKEADSEADEGTMMQIRVLVFLKEEALTTSDLAKLRKVSLQSASVLVQSLVEKGWVVREPDPKDRRQWLLKVTPEGEARARASLELLTSVLTDVLSELSPEELDAASVFLPALRRIVTGHMTPTAAPDK
jgi:DNA-binding MarR family transcriptional regulator